MNNNKLDQNSNLGPLTVHNSSHIDSFISNHLNIIVSKIHSLLGDNLQAIILSGGFGRGEGSVRINKNGSYHVVNDYDIDIVFYERWGTKLSKLLMHLLYSKQITILAEKTAIELDIKQIDLVLKGSSTYRTSKQPSMAEYDLKYGHKILWGNNNPVDSIAQYKAADIPLTEGTWLMKNRGVGLLLSFIYLDNDSIKRDKKEYFYIEITKAILAMGECIYFSEHSYHNSYQVRAERFSQTITGKEPNIDKLIYLFDLASKFKLKPDASIYAEWTPKELWHIVSAMLVQYFLYYESKRLGGVFFSISDYVKDFKPTIEMRAKSWARLYFDRFVGTSKKEARPIERIKFDKVRTIAITMALLDANSNSGVDTNATKLALTLAALPTNIENPKLSWDWLNYMFLYLTHPKGEQGRALKELGNTFKKNNPYIN